MAKVSKTDLVFNTVSNFNWPFTAAEVADKLRWKRNETSSILAYLVTRGDIMLHSKEHSETSPIGYVNKYIVKPVDEDSRSHYESIIRKIPSDIIAAEVARRMK